MDQYKLLRLSWGKSRNKEYVGITFLWKLSNYWNAEYAVEMQITIIIFCYSGSNLFMEFIININHFCCCLCLPTHMGKVGGGAVRCDYYVFIDF